MKLIADAGAADSLRLLLAQFSETLGPRTSMGLDSVGDDRYSGPVAQELTRIDAEVTDARADAADRIVGLSRLIELRVNVIREVDAMAATNISRG